MGNDHLTFILSAVLVVVDPDGASGTNAHKRDNSAEKGL